MFLQEAKSYLSNIVKGLSHFNRDIPDRLSGLSHAIDGRRELLKHFKNASEEDKKYLKKSIGRLQSRKSEEFDKLGINNKPYYPAMVKINGKETIVLGGPKSIKKNGFKEFNHKIEYKKKQKNRDIELRKMAGLTDEETYW